MSEDILVVEDLAKYFGGVRAVDGVSLSIKRGSIVGLIGPNGSGKSTLFNTIAGVYRPNRGKVYFNGVRIDGKPPHEIYKLGLVRSFQNPRLFTGMHAFENLLVAAKGQRGEKPLIALFRKLWSGQEIEIGRKALDTAEIVGLRRVLRNKSTDLSGGQMKLLEIGRTLMSSPQMIMLDEPAAGVNPTLAHEIFRKLVELRDRAGITFFIIEHRLEILFNYVDYVYVMHRGRIVAEGPPGKVAEDPVVIEVYLGE